MTTKKKRPPYFEDKVSISAVAVGIHLLWLPCLGKTFEKRGVDDGVENFLCGRVSRDLEHELVGLYIHS